MRLFNRIILLLLVAGMSCTHEYNPEELVKSSWRVDVAMSFSDVAFWPVGQQVRVGVFESYNSKQPIESVLINQPQSSAISVSMSHVNEGVYRLKLYLTEAGVYKVTVADLGALNVLGNTDVTTQEITLLSYQRVQNQVFNNCQLCHGGSSGDIAANLNLTTDYSYQQLINVKAVKNKKMSRVIPGSANYSYLIKVLEEDIDFDHSASTSATTADRQLIVDWINQGAKNN